MNRNPTVIVILKYLIYVFVTVLLIVKCFHWRNEHCIAEYHLALDLRIRAFLLVLTWLNDMLWGQYIHQYMYQCILANSALLWGQKLPQHTLDKDGDRESEERALGSVLGRRTTKCHLTPWFLWWTTKPHCILPGCAGTLLLVWKKYDPTWAQIEEREVIGALRLDLTEEGTDSTWHTALSAVLHLSLSLSSLLFLSFHLDCFAPFFACFLTSPCWEKQLRAAWIPCLYRLA